MNSSFRIMKPISATTKRDVVVAKWVRITSLTLTLMLAASVSMGLPLHLSDNDCNPAEMQGNGCERMGIEPGAPGVADTAICCLLDCREAGPTGSAFNLRTPTFNVAPVYRTVLPPPVTLRQLPQEHWLQSSCFSPPNSYLKNLSLLI
jgi:hypothetical protein